MRALTIAAVLLGALFIAGLAVNFVGADPEPQGSPGSADCPNFVDADGDGVNDNCPNQGTRPQDGTGMKRGNRRANRGAGPNENCPNFVDEDGDGVNDNCPNQGTRPQDGSGAKKRLGRIRANRAGSDGDVEGSGSQDRIRSRNRNCDGTGAKIHRARSRS